MSLALNGTNGVTYNDGTLQSSAPVGRNRIINGDIRIHQRGGTITMSTANYNLDRFLSYTSTDGVQTAEQSTEAPVGFKNSLKVTTTTADASLTATQRTCIIHRVEGNNISDLDWGTSDAKTVTLSFWVRSSITGTHGGSVGNGSDNRAYPFTYAISSADTWEKKTVTIAGDTAGTWATGNGRSLQIAWGLGVGTTYSGTAGAWESADRNSATGATTGVIGTLNATWYLTGVQLETGTTATDFEQLQYGQQFALCQRYYQTQSIAVNALSTSGVAGFSFNTIMRAAPTITWSSGGVANRQYRIDNGAVYDVTSVSMFSFVGGLNYFYSFSPSGWAGGAGLGFTSNYVMSAEL